MILVDISGLLAAFFPDRRRHRDSAYILTEAEGPFVLSPFVLTELDYPVSRLAGGGRPFRILPADSVLSPTRVA